MPRAVVRQRHARLPERVGQGGDLPTWVKGAVAVRKERGHTALASRGKAPRVRRQNVVLQREHVVERSASPRGSTTRASARRQTARR